MEAGVQRHAASSGFLLVCCPKRDKFSETPSAGVTRSSLALLVFSRCFYVHYGHFEAAALFPANQLSVKMILTSLTMRLIFEYDVPTPHHVHCTALNPTEIHNDVTELVGLWVFGGF